MKFEIKAKDRILLIVACSALMVVLTLRLGVLPAMDAYEAGKALYNEKCIQAEEMQKLMDDRPVNEARITEGLETLSELSDQCYELMENRQIDELVTGAALKHDLFPSNLSISGQTTGFRSAYIYSADGGSGQTGTALPVEMAGGAVCSVEASIVMNGNESDMKAFLDDIEENYPAVHVKSFTMSENVYMNTRMEPVTEVQMNAVLEIYMYHIPEQPQ